MFSYILSITSLFNALDPTSVQQNVAFYELYSESKEGMTALERASALLHADPTILSSLCEAINPFFTSANLSEEMMVTIERLGAHFANRKLKGYRVQSEEGLKDLIDKEIDLGMAVILSQTNDYHKARVYSALLDMMALQIEAKLEEYSSPRRKIEVMNSFIFETMRFRFPPQSLYAKHIDRYTFLAQVMDEHLGVCLGVSTIILALGQRLGLPFEAITPPGHIYVRYRDQEGTVNIETTMRGVDVPEEQYLSIHTHKLVPRTLKEVVGMAHVNEASCLLHQRQWQQAKMAYEKALLYMEEDPMVMELLGFCKLFLGEQEGKFLLERAVSVKIPYTTLRHKMAEDFLAGRVELSGVEVVLTQMDESKESMGKRKENLEQVVEKFPAFREGMNQLALSLIMLNRTKEAMDCLMELEKIDREDPIILYYLTILHGQRKDYRSAWHYFLKTEAILKGYAFIPKVIKELRYQLTLCCPEFTL
jgi:tetratricopeptide (TPR) repeat protein